MNADGHHRKAREIEGALKQLIPDPDGIYVVAITELSYGMVQHVIACKMEMKYGEHLDTHVGLSRELRLKGEIEIADLFEDMDNLRAGRWYGGKTNGKTIDRCLEFIKKVKIWGKL